MKENAFISINLENELLRARELGAKGGNYEEGESSGKEEMSYIQYYVNDLTAGLLFGPYASSEDANAVARKRRKSYPDHNIIVEEVHDEEHLSEVSEQVELRFWVLHYEKNRRYGPYNSFNTAMGVMNRKRKAYLSDTFNIEEEEFNLSLSGTIASASTELGAETVEQADTRKVIFVLVYFKAQGMGSFKAGKYNTAGGDAFGWFKAGTVIRLSAEAAPAHKFSHWTFDGNFGGAESAKTVAARKGMRIVAIFKPSSE